MILDGYWKPELERYVCSLKFWGRLGGGTGTYTEHQVNKYLLYSAAIIRKLIEDEADAKKHFNDPAFPTPEFALLHYDLSAVKYKFDGDRDFILHNVITDYYKSGNQAVKIEAKTICNSIVHSYIWDLAYANGKKGVIGFLASSDFDKEKVLYFIKLTDWIDYINYCREKSAV